MTGGSLTVTPSASQYTWRGLFPSVKGPWWKLMAGDRRSLSCNDKSCLVIPMVVPHRPQRARGTWCEKGCSNRAHHKATLSQGGFISGAQSTQTLPSDLDGLALRARNQSHSPARPCAFVMALGADGDLTSLYRGSAICYQCSINSACIFPPWCFTGHQP